MLSLFLPAACGAAPAPAAWGVITIGGATYRLPAEVFDGGQTYQGAQDSMLLELPLIAQVDHSSADPLQVLLVAPRASDAASRDRAVRQSVMLSATVASSYAAGRRGRPLVEGPFRVADAPPGLAQVVLDGSDPLTGDEFARPPLGAVTEYVACARLGGQGGAVHFPLCEHEFAGPGMIVKVTYPREALPRWDAIRRTVLTYLQAHKVSP